METETLGRPARIEDDDLLDRLSRVFRDVGYEGATLSMLSEGAGLKRASLYHRFPGGKEQMAREVLAHASSWLEEEILTTLRGEQRPEKRIKAMTEKLDRFYSGGRQACLLNMLSSASIHEGPFVEPIKSAFEAWIDALAGVAMDAGVDRRTAGRRAERVIMLLQGSLVFARGTGSVRPFKEFLKSIPDELFG